jgi:hydrogenase expression/formation protein HypE
MTGKDTIRLAHGSGGSLTRELIEEIHSKYFTSPLLNGFPDSSRLNLGTGRIAFTTDTYVVDPPFFPGGDIGKLAVCGTVNDLAVEGATPRFISCALIVEEGFSKADFNTILASIRDAAKDACVEVVTGDTKVVPKGQIDKIYINTAGIGVYEKNFYALAEPVRPGDVVIVSGPIGDHGAAVMAERENLNLESTVESDCAPVTAIARAIFENARRVSFMRDVTRGGLATILNEAATGEMGILIDEDKLTVREEVRSICELLGIDPLYLACEGRVAAIIDPESVGDVKNAMAAVSDEECSAAGKVTTEYRGKLVAKTTFGTHRLVGMLAGEQLPRIC